MTRAVATSIAGLCYLEPQRFEDERGYFARFWDLESNPIPGRWVQGNVGFSHSAGTLRGLHFQNPPAGEWKLVWCSQGRLFDVVADLRPESPTFGRWEGFHLEGRSGSILVPPGCAHGYQTLVDETELRYLTDQPYQANLASGVRWNDPRLEIEWPMAPTVISAQDQSWVLLERS